MKAENEAKNLKSAFSTIHFLFFSREDIVMKNLLSKINENMHSFSKGQKLIANFITEHYDKAAFMTASKLGTTVGVSESTVVRFATELGYDLIGNSVCVPVIKAVASRLLDAIDVK